MSTSDLMIGTVPNIAAELLEAYHHIAQTDKKVKDRSKTAQTYGNSLLTLFAWMKDNQIVTPNRLALERWRDEMLAEGMAVTTVNTRLTAARKLLLTFAVNCENVNVKLIVRDWATVEGAKTVNDPDRIEEDYGTRYSIEEVKVILSSYDTTSLSDLQERAMFAVMAGAGLRVSEVAALTYADVFETANDAGVCGIRVRNSKHHRSRISVLGHPNHWVLRMVREWAQLADIQTGQVFRPWNSSRTMLIDRKINPRTIQLAMERKGLAAHDLRRTYAKLAQMSGLAWEDLRDNLGHASVVTTERYVGKEQDWGKRVPKWDV
jgi:site-specific recombinase XerD